MHTETIPHCLKSVVKKHGSKIALTFSRKGKIETELTFNQLENGVYHLAQTLLRLGVQQSDRVVIFIPKSIFSVIAHFAIQTIGAIAIPLNPGFKKNEMNYLLKDSSPTLIILEPEKTAWVQSIYSNAKIYEVTTTHKYHELDFNSLAKAKVPSLTIKPEDPALIIYTSGTTGNPKGAVLSHQNLIHDAHNISHIWDITADDVLCHALPLFHVHGLCFALHTTLFEGGHVIMLDSFDPEHIIAELSRKTGKNICSVFMAVPAMYTTLLDFAGDLQPDFNHLRLITSGSAPLPVKEFKRISNFFGQEPVEREGMSETGMNFSNPLKGERIPGSIGRPLPGLQIRIVDPESYTDVSLGEIGELWLKSKAISKEYWQKPIETKNTFEDGWFRTGDLCRVDQDGYYYLTDRIKHIIISGGENVSAKEVETIINQLDGVEESIVIGSADEKWGEIVVAAIKKKPNVSLTETDVKSFCKQNLHNWKCPKKIIFINEIPRNTMGKVLKEEVKKYF